MVVSRLVESRLVTRTAARGDARRLSISLTPAGRALLRKAPEAAQTQLVEGLRSLSRGELHALAGHLSTLTSLIGAQIAAEDEGHVLRPKVVRRA